jgi:hypothetical protein
MKVRDLRRGLLGGSLGFSLLAVAASAVAVDVRGSIQARIVASGPTVKATRSPYWREWNGFIEPKKRSPQLSREVTVVLIGDAAATDATTALLKNGQLTPQTIVMQQGMGLRIRNEDDFTHQLYADGLKAFDAIETSAAQGRQLQIEQTGTFAIHDQLAPHVRGTLVVLPKVSAVGVMKDDGTFTFSAVPAGKYELKVFREGKEVSSVPVELAEGREIALDPIEIASASK